MTVYKVTLELTTPWHKHLLRFFNLISPRKEFEIKFEKDYFELDDILQTSKHILKVIDSSTKKKQNTHHWNLNVRLW